jgi:SHS2 domain-containing protein
MTYKFLTHTADIKIQVISKNLEEAFIDSANALKEVICDKVNVKEKITKTISVKAYDLKSLLYSFLEEFLYLLDAENFLFKKIKKLKIKDFELNAEITGDIADNYEFVNQVKAITYSEMDIKQERQTSMVFVIDV